MSFSVMSAAGLPALGDETRSNLFPSSLRPSAPPGLSRIAPAAAHSSVWANAARATAAAALSNTSLGVADSAEQDTVHSTPCWAAAAKQAADDAKSLTTFSMPLTLGKESRDEAGTEISINATCDGVPSTSVYPEMPSQGAQAGMPSQGAAFSEQGRFCASSVEQALCNDTSTDTSANSSSWAAFARQEAEEAKLSAVMIAIRDPNACLPTWEAMLKGADDTVAHLSAGQETHSVPDIEAAHTGSKVPDPSACAVSSLWASHARDTAREAASGQKAADPTACAVASLWAAHARNAAIEAASHASHVCSSCSPFSSSMPRDSAVHIFIPSREPSLTPEAVEDRMGRRMEACADTTLWAASAKQVALEAKHTTTASGGHSSFQASPLLPSSL